MLKNIVFLLMITLFLAACSGDEITEYKERSVEELYTDAVKDLRDKNYSKAAKNFDEVERQHPYSNWAKQAQIMAAYAYYKRSKYDDAIATLDRFIQLHPGHKDVAYAYYLKAISYYEQISDVHRDQSMTKLSLNALKEVAKRFPNTPYARDATLKIDLTRDHLAGKEMAIGRYYQKQNNYLAAINRFNTVVYKYETTTQVQEALYRLTESYLALGLKDQAKESAAVLGHNYPGGAWYQRAYSMLTNKKEIAKQEGKDPGLLNKAVDWVF